jgi:hypothetical protein
LEVRQSFLVDVILLAKVTPRLKVTHGDRTEKMATPMLDVWANDGQM